MNKKIFIEDGLCLYKKTGTGQYTINLYNMLQELGYDVIMPRKYFMEKIKNPTIKRTVYVLWLNIIFPLIIYVSGAKKIFFTNTMTPFYKFPGKEFYPVLHDLWSYMQPATMGKIKKWYQDLITKTINKPSKKIITVSNTVKKEIIDFYKCNEDFVKVIYNYFSFGEKPKIHMSSNQQKVLLDKFKIENKKYILSVANLNKRKNLQALAEAYDNIQTNIKLVLVGNLQNEEFSIKNENIIFTGYLSDEEIKVLYKNALFYAFPSLYEGFGIPIIDAQSFGIPVLCSDIPVFHEVAEDTALFSTPETQNLSEKITQLIDNESLRQDLIERGYINIQRFNKEIIKEMIKRSIE